MSGKNSKPGPKVFVLAGLGLLIPVLLVAIAFLAIRSDAKNQKMYEQQRAEMDARIAERERLAAEQANSK